MHEHNPTAHIEALHFVLARARAPAAEKTKPRKSENLRGFTAFTEVLAETEGFEPSIQVLAQMLP
jgi:hypothetical protein